MKTDPNDETQYLTKKELFAAMALQGCIGVLPLTQAIRTAVNCANLLIKELNKELPEEINENIQD